ncbi:DNA gyrase inhibitor YacG [Vitreoscilla massiliensis]|uniref:DNA gyrase inhibitor YacG n=1 Tax=Vitreoscilla massiliensis TaxID=1689272 RepID=A0ABY4DXX9_9NEIS|nr:DNA gyrase inhibitor YacG [Vitreoscilla massiliensis]UOO88124.1 DNA gyrase inhibitor YacG [Vitreoscilla massiliensis]
MEQVKTVKCPQCGVAVAWLPENRYRPFCSERCKMIDLGAWAESEYSIAADNEDIMSEAVQKHE